MTADIPHSVLVVAAGLLRAVTLPAGLLLGGSAGAATVLQGLGVEPAPVERAARRLAGPLLLLLLAAALPLAVVETLWETEAPLSPDLFTDLLPYMLAQTLFGVVWGLHLVVLGVLLLRLRRGHTPGLLGSLALLAAWPQIGHLLPNYAIGQPDTVLELSWLAIHRAGAALWPGTLAVLLLWSRPTGPVDRPWGAAFARLALPGAGLLLAGAAGTLLTHGGLAAVFGRSLFPAVVEIKIGLLVVLLGLGALHFRRYRRPAPPTGRGTLAAEVAIALVAVLLGALLGLLPTPGT